MPLPVARTEPSPIGRREWLWLAAAILVAAILRLSFPGRMAIEHFDEGVYASNFWFGVEDGFEYPARHLYAPPLLPMAIEWTMIFASLCGVRPVGFIPMIPGLIAGIVSVPSVWWVGRRWFGPTAGIVSCWLVATSNFHSSYSRTALTDVPLCLFVLWGVYFIAQALDTGTRRNVILAALFTGLAWWTKYNGWLPLAVGLAGGAAWQISRPRSERRLREMSIRWLIVAGLSFLVWCPVLAGLQKHGGYQAVAANHRQYIVGFSGWLAAANRQFVQVGIYDNWVGTPYELLLGSIVARDNVAAVGEEAGRPVQRPVRTLDMLDPDRLGNLESAARKVDQISRLESFALTNAVIPGTLVLATPVVLLLTSLAGCLAWSIRGGRSPHDGTGWFLLAWICGLGVATPFYQPYPRLTLPWLIAVWLGTGLAVQLLVNRNRPATPSPAGSVHGRASWIDALLIGGMLVSTICRCMAGTMHAWQDRSGLSRAMNSIANNLHDETSGRGFPDDEAIVYVFGEPPVLFGLKANNLPLAGPVQNLAFLATTHPRPTFLILTERAFRSESFRTEWKSKQEAFEPVAVVRVFESHLVHFDQNASFPQLNESQRRGESVRVHRVR
jgi:4-amino-4-deoxy-L-arabinose transferase-like glycosyltransferase